MPISVYYIHCLSCLFIRKNAKLSPTLLSNINNMIQLFRIFTSESSKEANEKRETIF